MGRSLNAHARAARRTARHRHHAPLLLAIDDVELATGIFDGGAANVGDVRASVRLSDRQADKFLPSQTARGHALLQLFAAEVKHRRKADAEAADDAPYQATTGTAAQLVHRDCTVEGVPRAALNRCRASKLLRPLATRGGKDARLRALLVERLGDLLRLVPGVHVGHHLLLRELTHLFAPANMRGRDEGRRVGPTSEV